MKKTITLSKAVELKTKLENAITEVYEEMRPLLESDKTDLDKLDELNQKTEEIKKLTIDLHVKIQEANLKKGKGKSQSNAEDVKEYSILKIRKQFENSIDVKGNKKKQEAKSERVNELSSQIQIIHAQLDNFNKSQKVKIDIPESLITTKEDNVFIFDVLIS